MVEQWYTRGLETPWQYLILRSLPSLSIDNTYPYIWPYATHSTIQASQLPEEPNFSQQPEAKAKETRLGQRHHLHPFAAANIWYICSCNQASPS